MRYELIKGIASLLVINSSQQINYLNYDVIFIFIIVFAIFLIPLKFWFVWISFIIKIKNDLRFTKSGINLRSSSLIYRTHLYKYNTQIWLSYRIQCYSMPCHIISYHIKSYITLYHFISYDMISYYIIS